MASVPVEILFGIYLGILTGIIPALASWALGFGFKYFTGVTVPPLGVLVLAVALAGVSGGLLALANPAVTQSANAPTLITGILVVSALSLYSHARGDHMGATVPKRLSLSGLRDRTLSRDVVDLVGGRDEVRITVTGDVADMEGYPPLSSDLRAEIRAVEYTFPADLQISDLETRFAERLRTELRLGDVAVSIDERGHASVTAAPPLSGLSQHVSTGNRALSVEALVPTGVARGDEVRLGTDDGAVVGTVVSAVSDGSEPDAVDPATADPQSDRDLTDEGADEDARTPVRAPTTTGGEGRLTITVAQQNVDAVVDADRARVVVTAQGTRLEYELVSLLRRTGKLFQRFTITSDSSIDGTTLGAANVRAAYGVAVLAVRQQSRWELVPDGTLELAHGDDVFAVGSRRALDDFAEAVAE
ncbi:potassium channel family protein [Halorientalis salina]|uniref:potassium channel family protein n=1 Tax=Halorientalis salina TaxID=2932266 RepID=UPI0010AC5E4C|nr:TrkA C-terminal domain-containing protein [Halorientalis salina]